VGRQSDAAAAAAGAGAGARGYACVGGERAAAAEEGDEKGSKGQALVCAELLVPTPGRVLSFNAADFPDVTADE